MKSDEFHIEYEKKRIWENTTWMGIPMFKLPFDAFIIQELIVKHRPDYIIETGTGCGGSAVFYASICELIDYGYVITVDIEDRISSDINELDLCSDRIKFLNGSSTDQEIIKQIEYEKYGYNVNGCMVILDSWHSKQHVYDEMNLYSPFVPVGGYMIVEDSHANGNPVPWEWNDDGPMGAIEQWLEENDNWGIDKNCERHLMTFNPSGYLKRIR